jgi:hypothetical protein
MEEIMEFDKEKLREWIDIADPKGAILFNIMLLLEEQNELLREQNKKLGVKK